jgi:copper transport protein
MSKPAVNRRLGPAGAVVALVAALAGWLAVAPPASAHAELVSSTPADGAELATPPTEIRLVFSEAPQLRTLSVRLFDRRGTEISLGQPSPGPLATTVIVPIPTELRPGPYTVVWFVVSAEDEHPETREFVFGIGEPPGAPSVTAGELPGIGENRFTSPATLLAILGLTLMLGAAVQARSFGLRQPAVVGAAVTGAGLVVASLLAKVAGTPRAPVTVNDGSGGLLAGADPADLARFALLVGFAAGALAASRSSAEPSWRRLWLVALVAAVGLAWLQAATSHAAGAGILPWVSLAWSGIDLAITDPALYAWFGTAFELARQLNILVAAVHTIAVGAWVGGLLVISVVRLPADELAAWQPRFSRFALRAFLVVAATGLYQAVLYLPAPSALVGTDYGQTLVAKHVFVVGVLAMATLNRFVAGPALRRTSDLLRAVGRARWALRAEALLGIGVLGVTAVLATTAPARPPTAIFLRPDVVAAFADTTASIAGDRPGLTLDVSRVSGTHHRLAIRGSQPIAADAVLTLSHADSEATRRLPLRAVAGSWQSEGLAFPRDGAWVASVPLADGSEARFELEVSFGRVAARHPEADDLWDQAIERTEVGMDSARMIDQLTDGLSVMLFGHHEFEAPDRERFEIQGRFSTVVADGRRYTQEAGSTGWEVRDAGQVRWPDFGFLRAAIGVRPEGTGSQAGERCRVLAGFDPQSDVVYEIWVGQDDGMIHRLVMGLPGHYMVNAYYDVNAPVEIEPPADAASAP